MEGNLVFTIGRQSGSKGNTIGSKLAESLGIKCYNKELLTEAAKNSGLCKELFERHDEKPTNSFLYSLVMDTYSMGYRTSMYMDMPINHKIFLAQFDTIKKIASEESCVFVGRCADYILREHPNCLRVCIRAREEDRIRRIVEEYGEPAEKAREILQKKDKQRANYYSFYSHRKWNDLHNYDLVLNSSLWGIQGSVELIRSALETAE